MAGGLWQDLSGKNGRWTMARSLGEEALVMVVRGSERYTRTSAILYISRLSVVKERNLKTISNLFTILFHTLTTGKQ